MDVGNSRHIADRFGPAELQPLAYCFISLQTAALSLAAQCIFWDIIAVMDEIQQAPCKRSDIKPEILSLVTISEILFYN